ncbi:sigma-E factor negative regulatory protein [Reinekea blandensis]|uniref:Anti sigma-E protein RseA N-terminal domain-containing protein n=1 Tax=Reinekea blandensis MED297 TaxID=314283 RepID=A4BBJ1_9GAMM|nr:sigma-E factor negative regulatory protein [Reinekea blandensis]EAR10326.1 hypothetical protein MED297_00855 [Reinekea sp. MED297] [Reinekea blandensis MED297]
MSKANESFSAFLDGEASELDIQRLLKAMDEDPQSIQQWHDLSKVKASLQGDTVVDTALNRQPGKVETTPAEARSPFWLRLVQGGIAATVAAATVAVIGLNQTQSVSPEVATVGVDDDVPLTVEQVQQQVAAQQRLTEYLKNHAEQASFTSGHVVVPAEPNWIEEEQ